MKKLLSLALLGGLPGLGHAQESCAAIGDEAERLACFDRATARCAGLESDEARLACFSEALEMRSSDDDMRKADDDLPAAAPVAEGGAGKGSAPRPENNVVAAPQPEAFGQRETLEEAKKQFIEGRIVKVLTTPADMDYLWLDNGQVWRETQDSRVRFREGQRVTITEGVLNSYDLRVEGSNRITKVKRER